MRVLHVTERHDFSSGGLTTALNSLMAGMMAAGHQMAVFSVGARPLVPKGVFSYGCAVEGAGRFWMWSRGLRGRLDDAIHHFRPQVIHTHGCWMAAQLFALQLARKLGIPTVASFHNFLDPQVRPEPLNKLKKAAYWSMMGRRVFEHADVHHAITMKEVAHIRKCLPRARIIVIPHLLQDLPASAQIAKETVPRNKIAFLGRIARVKGIEQLIAGFALSGLAGDWELVIAGPIQDNEFYQLLLKKAQELSVAKHVSFIGPVAGEQKWSLLRNAWIVCAPSHTEALGMVNLEAALCGTPSVTTPNSGLSEWYRNGGLLCEPTSGGVAAALTEAAGWSQDERAHRGRSRRKYVTAEFTSDSVRSKWAETYLRLHEQSLTRPNRQAQTDHPACAR
jgi:glycosyltransferase involved in cell wall biosynthesis